MTSLVLLNYGMWVINVLLKRDQRGKSQYPRHLVHYNISSIQVLPFLPSWHPHTYTFLTHSHARNGLKSLNKNSQGKPQFPMGLPNIQSIPSFLAHARSIPSSVGREVLSSAIPSHSVQDSAQPKRDRKNQSPTLGHWESHSGVKDPRILKLGPSGGALCTGQ